MGGFCKTQACEVGTDGIFSHLLRSFREGLFQKTGPQFTWPSKTILATYNKDEMGFTVWPTIPAVGAPVDVPQSDRNNRKVRKSSILCIFSNVVKPISSLHSILSSYFRFYRS